MPSLAVSMAGGVVVRRVQATSNTQELVVSQLNGDLHGRYRVDYYLYLATGTGGSIVSARPNQVATNQISRYRNEASTAGTAALWQLFDPAINIASGPLVLVGTMELEVATKTGGLSGASHMGRGGYNNCRLYHGAGSPSQLLSDSSLIWTDKTTNLTSISIFSSTGLHLLVGSQIIVSRLPPGRFSA